MVEKTIGYKKSYRMRRLVPGKDHISITLPYEVVAREAANRGLTVEEFIEQFEIVAEYDSFEGVHYTFVDKGVGDESK